MALRIVVAEDERCLRSVGDPPHGLVGFQVSDTDPPAWCLHVSGTLAAEQNVPPLDATPGEAVRVPKSRAEMERAYAPQEIEVDDAVAGLADRNAARLLWMIVVQTTLGTAEHVLYEGGVDTVRAGLDGVEAVREALVARDWTEL